jgi:hypothetical protein
MLTLTASLAFTAANVPSRHVCRASPSTTGCECGRALRTPWREATDECAPSASSGWARFGGQCRAPLARLRRRRRSWALRRTEGGAAHTHTSVRRLERAAPWTRGGLDTPQALRRHEVALNRVILTQLELSTRRSLDVGADRRRTYQTSSTRRRNRRPGRW